MVLSRKILAYFLAFQYCVAAYSDTISNENIKNEKKSEKNDNLKKCKNSIKNSTKKCNKNKIDIAKGSDSKLYVPESLVKAYGEENSKYVYLNSIIEIIQKNHVVMYSRDDLVLKAIEGFLNNLDPHTSYLNEKAYKSLMEQTDGEFGGIGTEIILDSGLIRIITPIDDTPAYKVGLKPGDYILCIDDEYINNISSEEAVEKLRGKPGSVVKLKIKRTGKDPFDVDVKRAVIKIQSVKTDMLDGVAYIRVSAFDKNTTKDIKNFLEKLKKDKNNPLKGVVLDMRNNPGGLLTEAFSVADLFIDNGLVVTTKGRDAKKITEFKAKEGDILNGLPLVVIVNNGTASAPEIVAGALQDNKRATIVGIRTFGKGSVQQIVPLSPKTGMRVTIAMHYRPCGKCLQGHGISPDIEVNPAIIQEIKELTYLREENIKHSIGGVDSECPKLIENNSQKALPEKEKEKTVIDFICNLFKKDVSSEKDKKDLDRIKNKLNELNSKGKGKKSEELEEDFDLLYRSVSLKERLEKDLQLRTAFNVVLSADLILKNLKKGE